MFDVTNQSSNVSRWRNLISRCLKLLLVTASVWKTMRRTNQKNISNQIHGVRLVISYWSHQYNSLYIWYIIIYDDITLYFLGVTKLWQTWCETQKPSNTTTSSITGDQSHLTNHVWPISSPIMLLQVILNKDVSYQPDPILLEEPSHVMLNHLYAQVTQVKLSSISSKYLQAIRDDLLVLSSTQRFRKKYVTTLLYKPIWYFYSRESCKNFYWNIKTSRVLKTHSKDMV